MRGDYAALRELVEDCNSRQTPTALIDDRVLMGFEPGQYEAALRAAGIKI